MTLIERIQHSWLRLKIFLRSVPIRVVGVTLALAVLTIALAINSQAYPPRQQMGNFAGQMAEVQAGVLAIVFSVVILAMQLTADRYSTQLTKLYVRSPDFIMTFVVFLISISLDMAIMYNVTNFSRPVVGALSFIAGGVGVIAAIWLVHFIVFTFRKLTPEGIVSLFRSNITPRTCLERFDRPGELDRSEVTHPLLPLYSLAVEATQNKERFTALRAVAELGEMAEDFLELTFAEGEVDERIYELFFQPVLTEYFPIIIEISHESGLEDITDSCLQWITQIGSVGIESPDNQVAKFASDGLEQLIEEGSGDVETHAIVAAAWDKWCSLVGDICMEASAETSRYVLSGFEQELNRFEESEFEDRIFQQSMSGILTTLQRTQSFILDRYADSLTGLDVAWSQRILLDPNLGTAEENTRLQLFFKWRNVAILSTSVVLNHLIRTDRFPVQFKSFQNIWTGICLEALQKGPRAYAETISEIYLEIACLTIAHAEGVDRAGDVGYQTMSEMWADAIVRLEQEGQQAIIEQAFQSLRQRQNEQPRYLDRIDLDTYSGTPPMEQASTLQSLVKERGATM